MRLIDADTLMKVYAPYEFMADMGDAMEILANFPTVDAIPIEWIKKYTEENRLYQSDDFDLYISDMIADWTERKE